MLTSSATFSLHFPAILFIALLRSTVYLFVGVVETGWWWIRPHILPIIRVIVGAKVNLITGVRSFGRYPCDLFTLVLSEWRVSRYLTDFIWGEHANIPRDSHSVPDLRAGIGCHFAPNYLNSPAFFPI